MKQLTATLPLTVAIGGLAAALTLVLPFEPESSTSWLIGAMLASLVGAVVLALKLALTRNAKEGTASMKAVLTAQMSGLVLRVFAVGVGALAVSARGLSPVMLAFSFLLVSLTQQVVETRSLLARNNPKATQPVTP